jgi:serine/threonine protein kinase
MSAPKETKEEQGFSTQLKRELNPTARLIDVSELEYGAKAGRGAAGEVYFGTFRGVAVAIKRTDLQVDVLNDEYEKERLRAEAALMSKIFHPNIVALYGVCVTAKRGDQQLLLVMESCQFSLKAYLDHIIGAGKKEEAAERGRVVSGGFKLTEGKLMKLLQEIAAGMRYLHDRQPAAIIHRDLKPGNASFFELLHPKLCAHCFLVSQTQVLLDKALVAKVCILDPSFTTVLDCSLRLFVCIIFLYSSFCTDC